MNAVVACAHAFEAFLSRAQRRELRNRLTFANTATWSNYPQVFLDRRRLGVRTSTLTPAQWQALDTLLAAALGPGAGRGHDKVRQHLDADDHLRARGAGPGYGRGNFFVAFLGDPSEHGTWHLQFGGHHLAVGLTWTDGVLVGATPAFRGIEPFGPISHEGRTIAPELREQQALASLLDALDPDQLAAARLPRPQRDIVLGPGRDWQFPQSAQGLRADRLSDEQRGLLLAAVERWVGDLPAPDAARVMARYESELDDTHLAYTGGPALTEPGDYVRIDGPSVWLELSVHHGIVLDDPHPHAVWRDRRDDYGGLQPA